MTKSVGLYPSKCVEVRDNRNTLNNFVKELRIVRIRDNIMAMNAYG